MADIKGRVKTILIDRAPSADGLSMTITLGFTPGDYQPLADALNKEFNIQVTAAELNPLATINDVVVFIESKTP